MSDERTGLQKDLHEHPLRSIDRTAYRLDALLGSLNAQYLHARKSVYEEQDYGPVSGDHLTRKGLK